VSAKPDGGTGDDGWAYFRLSELPWHSLIFVLPMIAAYEIGIRWLAGATPADPPGQIVAFALMQRLFLWMGATGAMLPALAVVAILLAWHIARKDPWTLRPTVYVGMALESVILTAPLIALGMALPQLLSLQAFTFNLDDPTRHLLVLAFGAGVYEELLFRLIGVTLITILLADVLRVPQKATVTLAVVTCAATFSLYHYWGVETFDWRSMVFRTVAGIFFGILFVFRGFGVTVGTHTAYDIAVVALRQFVPGG
jgi:hypothetical protein